MSNINKESSPPVPSIADQILLWVGAAVVVVYGTRVVMFGDAEWGMWDFFGMTCVPLVMAMLLTLRLGFYLVARRSPSLFAGKRVLLQGALAWLVPPVVVVALMGLRETGYLNTRYTGMSSKTKCDIQSDSSEAAADDGGSVRVVMPDGATPVIGKSLLPRRLAGGAHRWTVQDAPEAELAVVGDGAAMPVIRQMLSGLSVADCSSRIVITVKPPKKVATGWFVFRSEGTWEVDVAALLWTDAGDTTTLDLDMSIESSLAMYGFCSHSVFVEAVGAVVGQMILERAQVGLAERHAFLTKS